MLLNEVQKQAQQAQEFKQEVETQAQSLKEKDARIAALTARLDTLERRVADSGSIKIVVAGR
jgi:hypothetical protein